MVDVFPAPERPLRLGLVGGGRGLIGRVHVNGARLSGRWELVAGALSSRPELAADLARLWQIDPARSYASWQEMAEAEADREDGIDAVAIVTPNNLHGPVARAFMARGIDIICEKPLAPTLAEAETLGASARQAGVVFGVTYPYAAHVMVRQARTMIARGQLGDIRQVHVEYFQEWAIDVGDRDAGTRWRLDPAVNGPSLTLADIGTHAEHLVRFVTGLDIVALSAAFHVTGAPKTLEDTAFVQMRLSGDVPATLMVSQAFAGTHCGLRIRVAGTRASLYWNAEQPEFLHFLPVRAPARILSRGHGAGMLPEAERLVRMPRGHPEALTDAWANLYLEFGIAIDARRRGLALEPGLLQHPTVHDGILGLAFVDVAVRSARNGKWLRMPGQ